MTPKTAVTQDDLLDALAAAMNTEGGEGQTTEDICEATGKSADTVRKGLRALAKQGRLDVVTVRRPNLAGIIAPVTAYRTKS